MDTAGLEAFSDGVFAIASVVALVMPWLAVLLFILLNLFYPTFFPSTGTRREESAACRRQDYEESFAIGFY